MLSTENVRQLALSMPEVVEKDHMGRASFRSSNRIFCTLWENENRAMVKLLPDVQSEFCSRDEDIFHPVPGGWGRMGCTFVELDLVSKKDLKSILRAGWEGAQKKK